MREPVPASFQLHTKLPEADIYLQPDKAILLVLTKANFIPMQAFKMIFSQVAEIIQTQQVQLVLFDKRSLTIFHQPSMEWYYLNWKNEMLQQHGLTNHGKLLPKDDLFRQSVDNARRKIFAENPQSRINELNIAYFENLTDVLPYEKPSNTRNI